MSSAVVWAPVASDTGARIPGRFDPTALGIGAHELTKVQRVMTVFRAALVCSFRTRGRIGHTQRGRRRDETASRCAGAQESSVVSYGCPEGVKAFVFDETLAIVRFLNILAGLGVWDRDRERKAMMQGDLSVKQGNRFGGREAQLGEHLFGCVLESGLNACADHCGLRHGRHPDVMVLYPVWGTLLPIRGGTGNGRTAGWCARRPRQTGGGCSSAGHRFGGLAA